MTTTGVQVQGEDPADAPAPEPSPAEPELAPAEASPPELTPAEVAALQAAKAAKKAEKARRKAEKARRLAEEYAQLATSEQTADGGPPVVLEKQPTPAAAAEADAAVSRIPLLVAAGVLVACLAFAVVALVVYLTSGSSTDSSAAAARDNLLLSARQDIVVLNTLDYHAVDAGLKRWASASTGTLHDSLTNVTAAEKQHIVSAKSVTTAKVLDAAVVSLDTKDGSATVIASVEITVTPDGGTAVVKRERLRAELTRVNSVWKVSSIGQVGVTIP